MATRPLYQLDDCPKKKIQEPDKGGQKKVSFESGSTQRAKGRLKWGLLGSKGRSKPVCVLAGQTGPWTLPCPSAPLLTFTHKKPCYPKATESKDPRGVRKLRAESDRQPYYCPRSRLALHGGVGRTSISRGCKICSALGARAVNWSPCPVLLGARPIGRGVYPMRGGVRPIGRGV